MKPKPFGKLSKYIKATMPPGSWIVLRRLYGLKEYFPNLQLNLNAIIDLDGNIIINNNDENPCIIFQKALFKKADSSSKGAVIGNISVEFDTDHNLTYLLTDNTVTMFATDTKSLNKLISKLKEIKLNQIIET